MPSSAFVTADFKVFDVKGFQPRMSEIRSRIRPKLEALGRSLAPTVSRSLGTEVFAHVAKHARRTVNPPEGISELADELMRTRDGQLVIGRATAADEAARWSEAEYRAAALETFRALVPLYRLR